MYFSAIFFDWVRIATSSPRRACASATGSAASQAACRRSKSSVGNLLSMGSNTWVSPLLGITTQNSTASALPSTSFTFCW